MKVHIGNVIHEVYDAKGMKMSEFAKRIGTVRQNVYKIFERESINTDLLEKISQVLEHDFFQNYVQKENKPGAANEDEATYKTTAIKKLEQQLEEKQMEIERLKKELELRERVIGLLEEKLKNKE